jgi:hypothetical protein
MGLEKFKKRGKIMVMKDSKSMPLDKDMKMKNEV